MPGVCLIGDESFGSELLVLGFGWDPIISPGSDHITIIVRDSFNLGWFESVGACFVLELGLGMGMDGPKYV